MEIEFSILIQNRLGFLGKQGGREERKGAAQFGKVLGLGRPGIGKSESALFGRGERRGEEERADTRDRAVSEEKRKRGRARRLADMWPC